MNARVHRAMENWLEKIKYVQECRKQEIGNAAKRQKENPHCIPVHDDKGNDKRTLISLKNVLIRKHASLLAKTN